MGLFKNFFHGCYYVVDAAKFKEYLEKELNFSIDNSLEASANLNIYLNNEKHHIQIWNYKASSFKEEQEKGLVIYFDEEEYKTIEEFYNAKLNNLPEYFKIELIDTDDVMLNEYKKEHPELNPENY